MPLHTVLVVEDDPQELDTILRAIAAHDIVRDVVIAADAFAAVAVLYAREHPVRADLIVIDADACGVRELQLPVLARAHSLTADCGIVTIVGDVHDLWRARSGRLVSDWFVRKPSCSRVLSAAITAACALQSKRACTVNADVRPASRSTSRRRGGARVATSRAASST